MRASGSHTEPDRRRWRRGAVLAAALLAVLGGGLAVISGAPGRAAADRAAPAGDAASAHAGGKPRRIVSLNLCADELALRLADPGTVVSVTTFAGDPEVSTVAPLARGIPANRGLAEEVVPLAPDLVITGAFTTRATTAFLKRMGIDVLELPPPASLDEAEGQIRTVAARLGESARGEALLAEIAAAKAALPPPPESPPGVVVLRPNGFTAGKESLADDLIRRAGLDNLATRLKPDKLGQLTVEEILTARPDILITDEEARAPSLARELMNHPALAERAGRARHVDMPTRDWTCAGPQLARALSLLAAARATP